MLGLVQVLLGLAAVDIADADDEVDVHRQHRRHRDEDRRQDPPFVEQVAKRQVGGRPDEPRADHLHKSNPRATAAGRRVAQVRNMIQWPLICCTTRGQRFGAAKHQLSHVVVLAQSPHRAEQKRGRQVEREQVNQVQIEHPFHTTRTLLSTSSSRLGVAERTVQRNPISQSFTSRADPSNYHDR